MRRFRCGWTVQDGGGSQIAEAALVMPLMFMMLLGVFWFGQAFSIYGTITHAARQGARAAVAPACATCVANDPSTNAFNAIQSALQAAKLDPKKLQRPSTLPGLCTCGSASTSCSGGSVVNCDSSQTSICVQGISHPGGGGLDQDNVQLAAASPGGGVGVCGISVSFQYPYTFWLPFTSLNKQQILLPAQAQMRVESQ